MRQSVTLSRSYRLPGDELYPSLRFTVRTFEIANKNHQNENDKWYNNNVVLKYSVYRILWGRIFHQLNIGRDGKFYFSNSAYHEKQQKVEYVWLPKKIESRPYSNLLCYRYHVASLYTCLDGIIVITTVVSAGIASTIIRFQKCDGTHQWTRYCTRRATSRLQEFQSTEPSHLATIYGRERGSWESKWRK